MPDAAATLYRGWTTTSKDTYKDPMVQIRPITALLCLLSLVWPTFCLSSLLLCCCCFPLYADIALPSPLCHRKSELP